jgi:hypothetical protein
MRAPQPLPDKGSRPLGALHIYENRYIAILFDLRNGDPC